MMKLKTLLIMVLLVSTTIMLLPIYSAKAETLVWTENVSSSGITTIGPVLNYGWPYRIVASSAGDWWYNYPANLQADAMYYTTNPVAWDWTNHLIAPSGHSFLQINEMDQNWGPFSNGDTGHSYSLTYVGKGEAIRFRIVDWMDGDYTNNSCHIPVTIYQSDLPVGGYSVSWTGQNQTIRITAYVGLVALCGATLSLKKRKRK